MPDIETHVLEVVTHLPGHWRRLEGDEAERARSQILDAAVCRSRESSVDPAHAVPEGLEAFALRLAQLEERVRRLTERLEKPSEPPPLLALRLRPDGFSLAEPGAAPPAPGDWIELKVHLPPGGDEPVWALGRAEATASGVRVSFQCLAQDQADRLVRYLLHRQRLDQTLKAPAAGVQRPSERPINLGTR